MTSNAQTADRWRTQSMVWFIHLMLLAAIPCVPSFSHRGELGVREALGLSASFHVPACCLNLHQSSNMMARPAFRGARQLMQIVKPMFCRKVSSRKRSTMSWTEFWFDTEGNEAGFLERG
ncbi:hypothetical protein BDV19DRAFT_363710, partial [Aspergillus venezuelensis]